MMDYEDPELGDENDPDYRKEMFLTYEQMGTKPDELIDPKMREQYRAWLEKRKNKKKNRPGKA